MQSLFTRKKYFNPLSILFILGLFTLLPNIGKAQDSLVHALNYNINRTQKRPIPYPVIPSPQFRQAVENGTRTQTDQPGNAYWMNKATYQIQATLSPSTNKLRGEETITYANQSPDTLRRLVVHLRQNFYKKGNIRNRTTDITGGIHLSTVNIDGQSLIEYNRLGRKTGYMVDGTVMYIRPEHPLAPGKQIELHFAWNFTIPKEHGSRMGQDSEVYFLGYWYPQMAVYDDIRGWNDQPYMGDGEFYMDYADFDVQLTVPQGWLIASTGKLQNPEDLFTPLVQKRLQKAITSDSTITIVNKNEREAGTSTQKSESGNLTWHYTADKVRDFAFGASPKYVWDATSARVNTGKTSMIYTFYRPGNPAWKRSAEFTKYAIENMSKSFMPYPWPNMSVAEGVIGGGMEYPMLTHIGTYGSARGLFGTIYHETGHMWFPMIVGSNEKSFAWMDEGLTSYNTAEGNKEFWPDSHPWSPGSSYYFMVAGTGNEVPPMRHADRYPVHGPARIVASYSKPSLMLHALKGILGEDKFTNAYREYAHRWAFKHPQPVDFFNTFEDVTGRDLDWFWTPAFYTTWTLDQSIEKVEKTDNGMEVTVKDLGLTPMPVFLRATYEDGMTADQTIPVDVWLEGNRTAKATYMYLDKDIIKIEIDPHHYLPDVDLSNNTWTPE